MSTETTPIPTRNTAGYWALKEKLIDYLQDAHALERSILNALPALIASSGDPEVRERLKRHLVETRKHEELVRERLEAHGASPSAVADVVAVTPVLFKGVFDRVRPDRQGKVGRDVYITEQTEIAAYSLLSELAERAGDHVTARTARFIRTEEEMMANWVAERWGMFVDRTLDDADIGGPRPPGYRRHEPPGLAGSLAKSPLLQVAAAGLAGFLIYQFASGGEPDGEEGARPSRAA